MRLLVRSAMIFFGTLMAAALLALGEPRATPSFATQGGDEASLLQVVLGFWPEPAAPSGR